jgi:hypothetical protein
MNLHPLTKLYDRLTPLERLPLVIAAGARGDTVEQAKLSGSAPKQLFHVPDYYGLAQALRRAANLHLLTLLDLAANFWQWWGLSMLHAVGKGSVAGAKKGQGAKAKAETAQTARAGAIACYYASRFVAHVDGWKQFCSEMRIDPEVLLQFMPGWDMITRTEGQARERAFTPEEAAWFVRCETVAMKEDDALERGPVPVETVAELAQAWQKILDKLVQAW